MAWFTLLMFCAGLLLCVVFDLSTLYALVCGLLLFLLYGKYKGFSVKELAVMTFEGVKTVKNILITMLIIGVLTAFWRAAGTIPVIVCYASYLIRPSVFLLMTFLLCCMVSLLTGTSFGSAATMGVICATMGQALGFDIRLVGGAVLSGVLFGDRCSPVSTSALLVAEVTGTAVYDNIRRMVRTAFVPFLLCCGIYTTLGLVFWKTGDLPDLKSIFGREFVLHPAALVPAAVIMILALRRVNVKLAMLISIASAVPVCIFIQHMDPKALLSIAYSGFEAEDSTVAAMLNGGGITSMFRTIGIIFLSSSYSGIFRKTGILDPIKEGVSKIAEKTGSFAAMLITSVGASMISCNQTLAVVLTAQLCDSLKRDSSDFALDLEDTAIVVAPMIPWSIAGGVPLASVGAPSSAILVACYLYLLPLWRLVSAGWARRAGSREP